MLEIGLIHVRFEAVVKKEGIYRPNEQPITYLINRMPAEIQTTKAHAKEKQVDACVESKFGNAIF